jgi:hypothetical protein
MVITIAIVVHHSVRIVKRLTYLMVGGGLTILTVIVVWKTIIIAITVVI